MADYKFTENGVFRYSDNAFIPDDTKNTDWNKYLEYVATGGQTDPWKTFAELKSGYQSEARNSCQAYIYSFYPPPIQQSMALGIYPSEMLTVMTVFIAACIEAENIANEQYEIATTEAELEAVSIVWPTP